MSNPIFFGTILNVWTSEVLCFKYNCVVPCNNKVCSFNNYILWIILFQFRYKFGFFIIVGISIKPSRDPTSDPPTLRPWFGSPSQFGNHCYTGCGNRQQTEQCWWSTVTSCRNILRRMWEANGKQRSAAVKQSVERAWDELCCLMGSACSRETFCAAWNLPT